MNILSLKLVILHHFSKNIESLKKKPCCYDNNYSNTSCSKNIVASSIFEARGCCMHVFLVYARISACAFWWQSGAGCSYAV